MINKENEMKKTISWTTTSTNQKVEVTIELITSEKVNLDGHICEVPACKIDSRMYVDGSLIIAGGLQRSNSTAVPYVWGRYGVSQDNYDRIMAADAGVKQAPEWIANEQLIAKNRAECAEFDKSRARLARIESGSY